MTSRADSLPDTLLYLAYGAASYHQEAVFSIASALARLRETPGEMLDIAVFADDPAPYRDLPVRVLPLDDAMLKSWRGPHGYAFRAKRVALRAVLAERERAVLIDTDTFFRRSPRALFERIQTGTLLCNRIGPCYGDDRGALLYRALAARLQERGLACDDLPLLNSGVIGLNAGDVAVLDQAIALMDELFPFAGGAYTLEEFVLAVARGDKQLRLAECPDLIHHYWSRKRIFRAKILAWLEKHHHAPVSSAALDDTCAVSDALPRPPRLARLRFRLGTALLPPAQRQFGRELLYGCYPYANEFDRACGPVWWEKAVDNLHERHPEATPAPWLASGALCRLLGDDVERIRSHLRVCGLLRS